MICKVFKRSKMGSDIPTENILGYTLCESTEDIYAFFRQVGISLVDYGFQTFNSREIEEELARLNARINSLKRALEGVEKQCAKNA
jgi:uncharacterized protein with PhoU and TrkA domain